MLNTETVFSRKKVCYNENTSWSKLEPVNIFKILKPNYDNISQVENSKLSKNINQSLNSFESRIETWRQNEVRTGSCRYFIRADKPTRSRDKGGPGGILNLGNLEPWTFSAEPDQGVEKRVGGSRSKNIWVVSLHLLNEKWLNIVTGLKCELAISRISIDKFVNCKVYGDHRNLTTK